MKRKKKAHPNHSESDEVTFQQGTLGMTFGNSIMIDQFYDGDNESEDNPDNCYFLRLMSLCIKFCR